MATSTDLFALLESNETQTSEEAKQKINEQFLTVHEPWLLNGLYDYYLHTNSIRCMEVLVNVREPHQNYLFNKLSESIKGSKHDPKIRALTLLGYVLQKDPPWSYRITEHQLLKDLLKLLKTENDIFLLLCALLVLVVLLPIVPSRMGQFLQDVFEIFSRLAAWKCSNPEKLMEDQMIHLQMALYALFQRLYGMYPCNFLAYLRNQYRIKEHLPIFVHTVKPMLDTVKLHPLLVTASKDKETTTERWKKMGAYDVILECEKFSLDVNDRCQHETCYLTSSFRSRSGTSNSTMQDPSVLNFLKSSSSASLAYEAKDFFSPSMKFIDSQEQDNTSQDINSLTPILHALDQNLTRQGVVSHEGTSPPEAAIEATPETTPVKDMRHTARGNLPAATSVAVRALNSLASKNWSGGSLNSTPSHSQPSSPMRKEPSPFNFSNENRTSAFALQKKDTHCSKKLNQVLEDRNQVAAELSNTNFKVPTSPLRIIQNNEVCGNFHGNIVQRIDSPISHEDEEVLEIVEQGSTDENAALRDCDSVIQEGRGIDDDLDEQEHGSPCTAGGLHMPNSKSVSYFCRRVCRLRQHSQCATESELRYTSTGSSPGNVQIFESDTVRRAYSCPEMKKAPAVPTKDNTEKVLLEADEDLNKESFQTTQNRILNTMETQTENFWPMPYEHLFVGLFPSLENNDVKHSPVPSPAPTNVQDKFSSSSLDEIIDKYIELAGNSPEKDIINSLKQQLQLLHEQWRFEIYRRQTHAFKNRRLLGEYKNSKALEELNSALKDKVQLQQKDIDNYKLQLEKLKNDPLFDEKEDNDNLQWWKKMYLSSQEDYKYLKKENEKLQQELQFSKNYWRDMDLKWQLSEAALIDARVEVQVAQEEAIAGERGKFELEQVNKQLLMTGEALAKCKEKLLEVPLLKRSEQELILLNESYTHEVKVLQQQLESKTTHLEACKARVTELEDTVSQSDDSSNIHKKVINEIKHDYDEKLKEVMIKYKNQLALSRTKDELLLDLRSQIETITVKPLNSPDISSCHEV